MLLDMTLDRSSFTSAGAAEVPAYDSSPAAATQQSAGILGQLTSRLPRFLQRRVQVIQRDLKMIGLGLRGQYPPPMMLRPKRKSREELLLAPRTLQVVRLVRETPDAVTLWLADPSGADIPFVPGQFFTVLINIEGQQLRRAYSACSSALQPQTVAITSKRVEKGVVSNYLNDHAYEGMKLQVLGPSGNFTVPQRSDANRHLVLLGGGSGLTPLLAIAQATLGQQTQTRVSLIAGHRSAAEVLFKSQLAALAAQYPAQFHYQEVLELAALESGCTVGRLDEATTERELAALPLAAHESVDYFLCGPAGMMAAARAVLKVRGVPADRIHEERFSSLHDAHDPTMPATAQQAEVSVNGQRHAVAVQPGETLLEAGLRAGLAMPYSCALGGCGACKVKLDTGEVAMQQPNCLTPAEQSEGFVLACVARPRTAVKVTTPS